MDPITAMAVASSAFSAIKKGFAAAKDVEAMSGDLSRWMGAVQSVKDGHQKAKSRRLGSVDEEALGDVGAPEENKTHGGRAKAFRYRTLRTGCVAGNHSIARHYPQTADS